MGLAAPSNVTATISLQQLNCAGCNQKRELVDCKTYRCPLSARCEFGFLIPSMYTYCHLNGKEWMTLTWRICTKRGLAICHHLSRTSRNLTAQVFTKTVHVHNWGSSSKTLRSSPNLTGNDFSALGSEDDVIKESKNQTPIIKRWKKHKRELGICIFINQM